MISTEALIAKFQFALDNDWGYIWGAAGIVWTAAKQQQKIDYMISKYGASWKNSEAAKKDNYYSAAANGEKWIGHTVADCSGLFAWAFKILGGYMYHGSNTMWDKYCTAKGELKKGKRDDGKELKPGTAIFTHSTERRGHVGLYIGDGWVIEASGTINGVIRSKITISKWKEWGELKGVKYENAPADIITEPAEDKVTQTYGTLKKGAKGPVVKYAQQLLMNHGFSLPKYGSDGDFGNETVSAVKAFQAANGLSQDGIIGKNTWAKLLENKPAEKPKKYKVIVRDLDKTVAEEITARYGGEMIAE